MNDSTETDSTAKNPSKRSKTDSASGDEIAPENNKIDAASLRNHLLIATPSLDKGIFKSSVTYICEHNEEGAMGIIINRPSTMFVNEILAELNDQEDSISLSERSSIEEPETGKRQAPVMVGGPVGLERGFVLHQLEGEPSGWGSSLHVTSDIVLTGSKDILFAMRDGLGPENYLVALGYAGWGAGQLEQELIDNAWIPVPANADILFSTPIHERAKAAAASLGIDLAALSPFAGNA